jgi:ANTAR domain-containing protein/GAF domain-containing protein
VDLDTKSHLVEIVATLKEVTALVSTAGGLPEAAEGVAKALGDIMPAHIRCGVTLISQGTAAVLASAGLPDEVLDETLHSNGDGPCLAAIRDRDIVLCPDLESSERWPAWKALARAHGIHGVLSYPFDVDTFTLGAINLYADRPDGLGGDVPIVAMLIADHASLLLRVRREQLPIDAGEDIVVQRAVGIVMAQRGCTPEQALRHLHDAATHLGTGILAVAQRLVQHVADRAAPA